MEELVVMFVNILVSKNMIVGVIYIHGVFRLVRHFSRTNQTDGWSFSGSYNLPKVSFKMPWKDNHQTSQLVN